MTKARARTADLMFLVASLIWGLAYPIAKTALETWQDHKFLFLAGRFWLAAVLFLPFLGANRLQLLLKHLKPGLTCGLVLSAAFACQYEAFRLPSTSGEVAFITAVSSLLVPLGMCIAFRQRVSRWTWVGFVVAAVGTYVLLTKSGAALSLGLAGVSALFGACGMAAYIILVGRCRASGGTDGSPEYQSIPLLVVQTVTMASICSLLSVVFEIPQHGFPTWSASPVLGIAFMAIFATGVAFYIQTKFQADTTADHLALVLMTEPVFAALFGYLLRNEQFSARMLVGALLIFIGVVAAEYATARQSMSGPPKNVKQAPDAACADGMVS